MAGPEAAGRRDAALDDLLERIAAEAARRASPAAQRPVPAWGDLAARASIEDPPGAPAFRVRDDKRYAADELLALRGDEFLEAAYRALLGRLPDPVGLETFRAKLARGDRPVEVIGGIAKSAEGRAFGASVAGLWPRYALALACRVPVAGWILDWVVQLLTLPSASRARRARDWMQARAMQDLRSQHEATRRRLQSEIERLAARRPGSPR